MSSSEGTLIFCCSKNYNRSFSRSSYCFCCARFFVRVASFYRKASFLIASYFSISVNPSNSLGSSGLYSYFTSSFFYSSLTYIIGVSFTIVSIFLSFLNFRSPKPSIDVFSYSKFTRELTTLLAIAFFNWVAPIFCSLLFDRV